MKSSNVSRDPERAADRGSGWLVLPAGYFRTGGVGMADRGHCARKELTSNSIGVAVGVGPAGDMGTDVQWPGGTRRANRESTGGLAKRAGSGLRPGLERADTNPRSRRAIGCSTKSVQRLLNRTGVLPPRISMIERRNLEEADPSYSGSGSVCVLRTGLPRRRPARERRVSRSARSVAVVQLRPAP